MSHLSLKNIKISSNVSFIILLFILDALRCGTESAQLGGFTSHTQGAQLGGFVRYAHPESAKMAESITQESGFIRFSTPRRSTTGWLQPVTWLCTRASFHRFQYAPLIKFILARKDRQIGPSSLPTPRIPGQVNERSAL